MPMTAACVSRYLSRRLVGERRSSFTTRRSFVICIVLLVPIEVLLRSWNRDVMQHR